MKKPAPERHTTFFNLMDALRGARGCPLCALVATGTQQFLDSLLFESVNDPKVRGELRKSLGFCREHARRLAGMRDAFGIAIIQRDLVRCLADRPEAAAARACPACNQAAETESRSLAVLAAHAGEPDVLAALRAGAPFCLPHFRAAVGRIKADGFRNAQVAKLRALADELGAFIEKHRAEAGRIEIGPERDAWLRALKVVVGEFE